MMEVAQENPIVSMGRSIQSMRSYMVYFAPLPRNITVGDDASAIPRQDCATLVASERPLLITKADQSAAGIHGVELHCPNTGRVLHCHP